MISEIAGISTAVKQERLSQRIITPEIKDAVEADSEGEVTQEISDAELKLAMTSAIANFNANSTNPKIGSSLNIVA